jgi:transcriptional regulator with XRE-family HTH domain
MDSEALVQLALDTLSCSQKDLANRLKVSATQISKWKKGEHMSRDMEEKLRVIVNIGDKDPSFVLWAGSPSEAIKWERLIHYLAEYAHDGAETGYDTYPLEDEMGNLCWQTFHVLREMGVTLPKEFPKELDIDYEGTDADERWNLMDENPYSAVIYKIYKSLNNVYGFYAAYLEEITYDDELDLINTPACNIEPCLMSLAACKIEEKQEFTPKMGEFKRRVTNEYKEWLTIVKDSAFRAGIPLRAELLDLVYGTDDKLGLEAEAESLGFNSTRLHPDVYMNELLVGMRVIHQVLPAIMKKLGIDEEFQLNTSELQIK